MSVIEQQRRALRTVLEGIGTGKITAQRMREIGDDEVLDPGNVFRGSEINPEEMASEFKLALEELSKDEKQRVVEYVLGRVGKSDEVVSGIPGKTLREVDRFWNPTRDLMEEILKD